MAYLIGLLVACAVFAAFGAWIAGETGRERSTGALIGGCFGPLGVLILALLPKRPEEPPYRKIKSGRVPSDNWEMTSDFSPPLPATKSRRDEDEDRALGFLTGK